MKTVCTGKKATGWLTCMLASIFREL